jgi:PAS domain S-box-containing protein
VSIWRSDSSLSRYGLAVLVVAIAALTRIGLNAAGVDPRTTTFSPFYAAIVMAALYGGLGPGLVAQGLSAVASLALWTRGEPLSLSALASLGIFLTVSGLIVWLTHVTRTARLDAERAEHRVQTVLDSITDSFVTLDFGWRYTYVNEAAQAYFGMHERDLIGRNCWEVFPNSIGTPLEASLRQVMTQREPITIELAATLRVGHWAQLHVSPTAEGISIVFRDITEAYRLRESLLRQQERMHRALEAARMATWEYDPRTDRVTYSASASDVIGIPTDLLPRTRAEGTNLIHPDDREAHVECVRRASRTAEGQYQSRYRLAAPYLLGRPGPVWIEDRGRMLFDAVGQLTMVQGVLQDVTEQRDTEERIRALNQDLRERIAERQTLLEAAERSSRAKDDFLAVLSHELRSPMQSVLGWVQVLRETPLDGDQARRALDTIERNLRQQSQLINDMLDVSRIVTGKLVFHLATLPLASVVRETIDELRPLADAKGLMVYLAIDGDLLVVADRERMRQVVSNLFTNAVKFTPAGGAVRVTCRERDGMAQLDVRDTGDGIDAELLPTIFERFRQADSSSTREHEGLGLGLSITKYIVDHLGGTISAASAGSGRGALFTVRLPLSGAKRTDDGASKGAPAMAGAETAPPSTERRQGRLVGLDLLVVDDHQDTVDLLAFIMRREGALVRTALSATDALAAWAERPARVVVTDLSMPGMDGFALLRALSHGSDVQAVALSGLARADDRQRALQAGFAAHLAKPVEPSVLIETVERLAASATHS